MQSDSSGNVTLTRMRVSEHSTPQNRGHNSQAGHTFVTFDIALVKGFPKNRSQRLQATLHFLKVFLTGSPISNVVESPRGGKPIGLDLLNRPTDWSKQTRA